MFAKNTIAALSLVAAFGPVTALADPTPEMIRSVTPFVGEMAMPLEGEDLRISDIGNTLRFEPIQNFADMFQRDDVVFLMRHGPTDWSKLDIKDVGPTDCEDQRILSDQGHRDMRDFGALMAFNDIKFGQIYVSQWCRNQQTLDEMRAGYDLAEPGLLEGIPTETYEQANLLLSLQGAPDVTSLRDLVSGWDGGDGNGPMLIISHFTNIQELTDFAVYEGEALVLDPKRDNRVLGYVRLKTASPDVGHFEATTQEEVNLDASERAAARPAH
ncbi:histidine phosphatase family protein [Palleronia sp. LCG004]|uniref:histidine phosphatase family protein n=1 Tax=Palleronia sp. LCG004 TaxID=3079304 RepID=UPI002943B6E1|nr:histidine phosphatase family protein [Palleronia sp. LCG004]WOI56073.1 histidine phosphatase family protein [Palleronia sp. LCG004]